MSLLNQFFPQSFFNKQKILVLLNSLILYFICFFIFVVPFDKPLARIFVYSVIILYTVASVIAYVVAFLKHFIPATPLNKSVLLFLAAAIFSVIASIDPYSSQKILFERYIIYAVFFWINYKVIEARRENIYYIILSLLYLGIIIGLGALVDYFTIKPDRLYTVFKVQVNLTAFLVFLMPLSLVLLSSKVNKSFRILSLVCILLLLPVAVFQGGRTLWSGVVLTVLLIFIGRKYWFFTIVFVSLLAALLMPKPLGDRAKSLIFPFSRQVLSDRIDLARSATNIFKEHPVFGAGLGSFGNLYKPPAAYKNNPTWQHLHAHNIYLEIAAEMGAFGLLAFLAVIIVFLLKFFIYWVKWVKSGGKINVINVAAGAAVIASLISNVSVSSIIVGFQDSLLFWMFLAIALKEVEV